MIREEQPQIIHIFSNGGSLCWANALGYERRKRGGNGSPGTAILFPSVTHVIADSCPGLAHLSDYPQIVNFLFAVTRNGLMPGKGGQLLVALLLPFITVVYVISYFLQLNFLSSINMWDQMWTKWINGALQLGGGQDRHGVGEVSGGREEERQKGCPHLLLYSDDDAVVSSWRIRQFGKRLRAKGVEVTEHCFASPSRHVRHFLDHKDEYFPVVENFLQLNAP
eukprot:CAMPEP_0182593836 /NCGR_PEP_ID=MMETSP1324-20130603/78907_1 /TAXON_ID=236786 /ORGANISM="Florenciella sp., Strain RCC1587" /LENGTH=222 /DNA_ID=CAMNT_0024811329 /DNA_START=89 /DNA_END=757 /DNA_ORIENTATION=-